MAVAVTIIVRIKIDPIIDRTVQVTIVHTSRRRLCKQGRKRLGERSIGIILRNEWVIVVVGSGENQVTVINHGKAGDKCRP